MNSMLFFLMVSFVLTLNAVLMIKISNQNTTVSAYANAYCLYIQIQHNDWPLQKIRNVLDKKFQQHSTTIMTLFLSILSKNLAGKSKKWSCQYENEIGKQINRYFEWHNLENKHIKSKWKNVNVYRK